MCCRILHSPPIRRVKPLLLYQNEWWPEQRFIRVCLFHLIPSRIKCLINAVSGSHPLIEMRHELFGGAIIDFAKTHYEICGPCQFKSPLLFRIRGRSSTRGQSTGLTFPRSVGRAFKPNSFMLQAALKSRSWCVPHLGQVQLRSLNFNPLYTWPHLPQVFELGAKRPVLMRFTPYQLR